MHGFGKSSMWTAAGFAVVGGLVLLQPTEASAQFNIEGIIRGALQQQGCCYGGGGYRYRWGSGNSGHHATSHNNNNANTDAAPPDKSTEKDATQLEPPNTAAAAGRQQQLSGPAPATSRSAEPDVPTRQSSAPHVSDDQPTFAPAR
jgi:hypothetical protein